MKTSFLILCSGLLLSLNCFAQWQHTGGPGGATCPVLFNDGNYLFAGTNGNYNFGGLFRSADSAKTWTQLDKDQLANKNVQAMVRMGNSLLIGTSNGSGVYKSTDTEIHGN
jgi:hypothetical protein